MPLPFVVPDNFNQTYTIKDETGVTLEIPKYGSLTWKEFSVWAKMSLSLSNSKETDLTWAEFQFRVSATLLKMRFKLPTDTPDEEVLTMPDGEPLPESMVMAIYEFFINEQKRWKPDPEPEPEEKKEPKKKLTGEKSS